MVEPIGALFVHAQAITRNVFAVLSCKLLRPFVSLRYRAPQIALNRAQYFKPCGSLNGNAV